MRPSEYFSRLRSVALAALAALVCACTTGAPPGAPVALAQAAATPLSDLNVVRAEIPAVLVVAQREPYARPEPADCAALAGAVAGLDEVLGADLDAPASAANPGLVERGVDAAGDAAVGALRRTAEGLVPFRSWVRKLSGAERYSREVAAAIAAGTVRRAFLKGLAAASGCERATRPRTPAREASR